MEFTADLKDRKFPSSDCINAIEPINDIESLDERRLRVNGVSYEVEMCRPFPLSNPDFLLIKT